MTIEQVKKLINSFIDPSVYLCIQGEDAKMSNEFEIVDIVSETMIQYKEGFDFEDEVIERIKYDLSEYSETEINKEINRVLRTNKKRKGIFVILAPKRIY